MPLQFPLPMELGTKSEPFNSPDFLFQIKWDGVRCLAGKSESDILLFNRRGNERTAQYPELCKALRGILPKGTLIDGEIIAPNDFGKPDFYRLLKRDLVKSKTKAEFLAKTIPVCFMVFDLLYHKGENIMQRPLTKRLSLLNELIPKTPLILKVDSINDEGILLFEAAKQQQLEGIVAKRKDSIYIPGKRTENWLKIKAMRHMDALIGGFTFEHGLSVLLGTKTDDGLMYIGSAGTGLTQKGFSDLLQKLNKHASDSSPFYNLKAKSKINFVKPLITVRIKYLEMNSDFKLRHPVILKVMEE